MQLHIENYIHTIDVNLSRRSGKCDMLLKPLLARTKTYTNSYFHRIVSECISVCIYLLFEIRESSSFDSFKHKLVRHYKTKLKQSFYDKNVCIYLQVEKDSILYCSTIGSFD